MFLSWTNPSVPWLSCCERVFCAGAVVSITNWASASSRNSAGGVPDFCDTTMQDRLPVCGVARNRGVQFSARARAWSSNCQFRSRSRLLAISPALWWILLPRSEQDCFFAPKFAAPALARRTSDAKVASKQETPCQTKNPARLSRAGSIVRWVRWTTDRRRGCGRKGPRRALPLRSGGFATGA